MRGTHEPRRRSIGPAMILAFAVLAAPGPGLAQDAETARMASFIDSLLAQMTIEEKLGQLAQYSGQTLQTGPEMPPGGEEDVRAGRIGSFLNIYGAEATRAFQRIAVEESRLGIPLLFAHDVIHGFRTIFPIPVAEAAAWNPEAAERSARVAAVEATAHGLHWTFAPMVDLARNPRWGRIVEGAGEDPYLASVLAAARVRGFQGTDLRDPSTLLACVKHFAAYGAAEGGRDYNVADISERTLREMYLPPYKAAVDAGAATVMAAFNEIAGVPAHADRRLLQDVLREEWGFDGMVVSDWTGVLELIAHGVAADRVEAGRLALKAGVDMDMISGIYGRDLPEVVREGRLDEALVDAAVRRVLEAKYRLGLFDDPYRYSDPAREQALTLTPEHRALAREIAQQSIVLLKNDGVLPLSKDVGTLAVIGPLADDGVTSLGGWAGAGRAEDAVTVLDGIRQAVSSGTRVLHVRGTDVTGTDTSGIAEAVAAARQADAVVLVLGETVEMSSEAGSRAKLDLPGVQQQLVEAIHATGKPVIALLMTGRPLTVTWLDEHVPAVVQTWHLGVEMGNAVADILFGDVNPSGKLPVTFPRHVGQVPLYYNHKRTGRPADEAQRYTSKYVDLPFTPLYPFGYGLSYTTFEYANLRISPQVIHPAGTVTVQADVTNTGSRAGDEIVQLYIRDEVASVTRPVKELRGFERITLQPGETKTVTFTLEPEDLSFLDLHLEHVVEPGFFQVFVGPNSTEGLEGRFEVIE